MIKAEQLETICSARISSFTIAPPPDKKWEHYSFKSKLVKDVPTSTNLTTPDRNQTAFATPSTTPPLTTPSKRLGGNIELPLPSSRHSDRSEEWRCGKCHILWNSDADHEYRSLWIQCTHSTRCSWWAHARCEGLFFENNEKGRKQLDRWLKKDGRYFCKKHMPPNTPLELELSTSGEDSDDEEPPRASVAPKSLKPTPQSSNVRSKRIEEKNKRASK